MTVRKRPGILGHATRAVAAFGAIACVAVVGTTHAATADGTLDTTFNTGQSGANGVVRAIGFTSDDKIYIAGDFTSYNAVAVGGIARLNSDGLLDTTFNPGGAGFARTSGMSIRSIAVAPDGDVYATGKFTSYNGTSVQADNVVRLNSDGTLDSGFTAPKLENQYYQGQPASLSLVRVIDGLVFVSGNFDDVYDPPSASSAAYAKGLIALDPSGSTNATFGANVRLADGFSTSTAYEVVKVPNSTDYYVHGSFKGINSQTAINFGRVKNDGTRNLDYANSGSLPAVGPNNAVSGMAVQSDGKILLGGNFSTFNGSSTAIGLVRVNPDATLDTSFKSPPSSLIALSLAIDSNGRIYAAGGIGTAFTSSAKTLVRLKSDGTLDSSFDVSSTPDNYSIQVAISPAGKVYVYGALTKFGNDTVGRIARVNVSAPQSATTTTESPATTVAPSTTVGGSQANLPSSTGVPGQPTNIQVKIVGSAAKVSWSAPTTGGAPTSYTATATPVGVAASSASATVRAASTLSCTATAPALTCTIVGLEEGRKYGFSVTAANASGGSLLAAAAKPLAVPVAKPAPTSTLPTTGQGGQTWLILLTGITFVGVGVAARRLRAN